MLPDALVCDPPYSSKTCKGHDAGHAMIRDGSERRRIGYGPWSPNDVRKFCYYWAPRTRGWFVAFCDDVLFPVYRAALEGCGRLVFPALPYVERGMTVRRQGDGHSSWTTWIVAARPRTKEFVKWGTLQGAYVLPPGMKEKRLITGQKTIWVMSELIRDHSRSGDLVLDPCCGSGTTVLAASRLGRHAIGAEQDAGTLEIARQRVFGEQSHDGRQRTIGVQAR